MLDKIVQSKTASRTKGNIPKQEKKYSQKFVSVRNWYCFSKKLFVPSNEYNKKKVYFGTILWIKIREKKIKNSWTT